MLFDVKFESLAYQVFQPFEGALLVRSFSSLPTSLRSPCSLDSLTHRAFHFRHRFRDREKLSRRLQPYNIRSHILYSSKGFGQPVADLLMQTRGRFIIVPILFDIPSTSFN